MNKLKLAALLIGLTSAVLAWAQGPDLDAAKQFVAQYATLDTYDPSVPDLYADEALIKQRRNMPMGEPRDVIIPPPKYRTRLRQSVLMARHADNRSTYSKITYTREDAFIRISALRHSKTKNARARCAL